MILHTATHTALQLTLQHALQYSLDTLSTLQLQHCNSNKPRVSLHDSPHCNSHRTATHTATRTATHTASQQHQSHTCALQLKPKRGAMCFSLLQSVAVCLRRSSAFHEALFHVCGMTHSYVCRDAFTCVT